MPRRNNRKHIEKEPNQKEIDISFLNMTLWDKELHLYKFTFNDEKWIVQMGPIGPQAFLHEKCWGKDRRRVVGDYIDSFKCCKCLEHIPQVRAFFKVHEMTKDLL